MASLKAAGWKIGKEPIQKRRDWKLVIINQFSDFKGDSPIKQNELFKSIFGNFPDLRAPSGDSLADDVACEFDEQYDKGKEGWTIAGKFYPVHEWRQALSKYVPMWLESQSTRTPCGAEDAAGQGIVAKSTSAFLLDFSKSGPGEAYKGQLLRLCVG